MVGFGNFVLLQGLDNPAHTGKLARIISLFDEDLEVFLVQLQLGNDVAALAEIFVKPENMIRACDYCHLAGTASMQYCGSCRKAAYCNATCQRNDWYRHKVDCGDLNTIRRLTKCPLIVQATEGNLANVEALIRGGANVNKASKDNGVTPLLMAAERGHFEVV